MTNKLFLFFLFLFLFGNVLALYPGETTTINLLDYVSSVENVTYIADGNFSIIINGSTAFVTAKSYSTPGTYSIIFTINGEEKVVPVTTQTFPVTSGGRHGDGGKCIEKSWICKNWTECVDYSQTRECRSNCRKINMETQACGTPEIIPENPIDVEDEGEEKGIFYKIFHWIIELLKEMFIPDFSKLTKK